MTSRQKYVLVVVVGWAVPMGCVLVEDGAISIALAAVAIAWWHGYAAARLEAKIEREKNLNSG